ncbi:MAG: translation elongation factor Ts [Elusimicrobia bacterium CG_4_10_14_0_2_um_filter_56_8]|nr:MAG: translation elongation factor Ts [Elusimicrobia bacterium CG1_02_56_21]PJA11677.1 MAG: translation elongation factor Ts [Elusimicrobia bacterium CG_4_10_14_0_2_um_filter_56_8]
MAAITSEQVMTLRGQTGAGIMDCKGALNEAGGDLAKAVDILRKKGLAGLAKRAGRAMKEGVVVGRTAADGKALSLLELNCETDFVAKNPDVSGFASALATEMLSDASLANPAESEKAKERLQAVAMKMGENMQIRRGVVYAATTKTIANYYVHSDNRKGAIVELSFDGDIAAAKGELEALARELAMQSVAMSPKYLKREEVPADLVESERQIYRGKMEKDEADAKVRAEGSGKTYKAKPAEVITKMLEGRVNKFFQECCLLEQASIRDTKVTVSQAVKNLGAKLGGNVAVTRFSCFLVGVE